MADPLVIPLKTPHRAMQRRAATLFAVAGAMLFFSTLSPRYSVPLQALAAGTTGFAMYVLWSAIRVRTWKSFRVELDHETLIVPMVPLPSRELVRVKLDEIMMVSYAGTGDRPRLEILTRSGIWLLPFDWFPKNASPTELGLRIHVRSQLARARQNLTDVDLAALEATMIAGKSYGAYVVQRLGDLPEVVATLDAASEIEAVSAELKGKGAKLVVCSERILALRDALERGLAAPLFPKSLEALPPNPEPKNE